MKMEEEQEKKEQEKNLGEFVEGEYLITIKPDYVEKENIEDKLRNIEGINIIKKFSLKEIYHAKIEPPKEIVEEDKKSDYVLKKVEELKGLEYILYIEPLGEVHALNKEQNYKENSGNGFNIV